MMTLGELLRKKKEAVARRWVEDVLATYADEAAAAFNRQKDPFANPVGHSLRVGTAEILQVLLDEGDTEETRRPLQEIVKIRAIQDYSAREAVAFVFRLKGAVRTELGKAANGPRLAAELIEFDDKVDRVALVAFDVYVRCREQVYQLRVNEAKRRYSWVVDKLAERGYDPGLACSGASPSEPTGADLQ